MSGLLKKNLTKNNYINNQMQHFEECARVLSNRPICVKRHQGQLNHFTITLITEFT